MDRLEERRAERENDSQDRSVVEMYDDNMPNMEADKIETSKATKDKPQRTDKVQDKDRTSLKAKLQEKKAQVAKNEASRDHAAPAKSREAAALV